MKNIILKGVSQNGKRLPRDPMLLLSVVNTKLRDYYHSLDALCDDMNVNKEEIISALKLIDYAYDSDIQQFV